ncbi:MAG TPA: hypothetical protein PLE01_05615, partial [Syntrophothermus lipocalidus]|nr:hypothetical protein [Syntrophothermus lipocalidus]
KKVFARWFDSTADKDIVEYYGEVMNWVNRQHQFYDWAKRDFASGADCYSQSKMSKNRWYCLTEDCWV